MHAGVAYAAERDEVCRVVVCRVQVDVMNMDIVVSAADGAYPTVAIENGSTDLLQPRNPYFSRTRIGMPNSSQKTAPSARAASGH